MSRIISDYTYREALLSDIPEMKFIRDHVTENTLTSMTIEVDDYKQAMVDDGKAWVCLKGNSVIGFSCGRLNHKDVWALFIDQRYEGQGIGHRLMELLEAWMFAQGCDEISLTTSPGTRAEHLYRRRGWQEMGISNRELKFVLKPFANIDITSVGYKTDLIFNQCNGKVQDRGSYIVATMTSNPNFFWGNTLIYKKPPGKGDLTKWKSDFKKEITHPATYHMTFGWDSPSGELGSTKEFIDDGFTLQESVVLTAMKVLRPSKYNSDVIVKPIESDKDFETSVQIQIACGEPHLSKMALEGFYRRQLTLYRQLIKQGKGHWFGAYLGDELVGSLGIFSQGELGRYQIVSTHPDHQRKGVCGTLVYQSAQYAFEIMKLKKLVMIADEHYHAAKIYEAVGFEPTEKMVGVLWYDKTRN